MLFTIDLIEKVTRKPKCQSSYALFLSSVNLFGFCFTLASQSHCLSMSSVQNFCLPGGKM